MAQWLSSPFCFIHIDNASHTCKQTWVERCTPTEYSHVKNDPCQAAQLTETYAKLRYCKQKSTVRKPIIQKIWRATGDNWARLLSRYCDWLWARRYADRIPVGRDFPPVQTGPGAHTASCALGTRSFPGVKYGRGVLLTTHHLLVPRSWKIRVIPLPILWGTTGPVRGSLYLTVDNYVHSPFASLVSDIWTLTQHLHSAKGIWRHLTCGFCFLRSLNHTLAWGKEVVYCLYWGQR